MNVNFVIILLAGNQTTIDTFQPAFTQGNKRKQLGNKKEQARHYAAKPVASTTSLVRDSGSTTNSTIRHQIHPNPSHNPNNPRPTYGLK